MLLKTKPIPTLPYSAQLNRWKLIVDSWKAISRDSMCTLIGDTNLDYLRWQNPEGSHLRMVQKTKDDIETLGFTQVINGHTRTWKGQKDSLVDQAWVNKPERIINTQNVTRGSSDHNYISITMRTKDKPVLGHETVRRVWKNFNPDRFRSKIKKIIGLIFINVMTSTYSMTFLKEK